MKREILKMGDPRLLERAKLVERHATPELKALVADMRAATPSAAAPAPVSGIR